MITINLDQLENNLNNSQVRIIMKLGSLGSALYFIIERNDQFEVLKVV